LAVAAADRGRVLAADRVVYPSHQGVIVRRVDQVLVLCGPKVVSCADEQRFADRAPQFLGEMETLGTDTIERQDRQTEFFPGNNVSGVGNAFSELHAMPHPA
jgi:hypothetical protein